MVTRTTSPEGIALIQQFEGFQARRYVCPAGKLSIGYGHVLLPGDHVEVLTEARATELLRADLKTIELYLTACLPAAPQCQFDALASFAYNCGLRALDRSTLLRLAKKGDARGAAEQFQLWVKATDPISGQKVTLPGLVKRRAAERDLFLKEKK